MDHCDLEVGEHRYPKGSRYCFCTRFMRPTTEVAEEIEKKEVLSGKRVREETQLPNQISYRGEPTSRFLRTQTMKKSYARAKLSEVTRSSIVEALLMLMELMGKEWEPE
jgi:hypothetical protein